jgi:hypothetical protein
MMAEVPSAADRLRIELAHKLGFPHYPDDTTTEPYLNYLRNRRISRITHEEQIELLLRVIASFDAEILVQNAASTMRSIQGLIDALLSSVKVGENHVVLGYRRERPMY